jgi:hypothetical protein
MRKYLTFCLYLTVNILLPKKVIKIIFCYSPSFRFLLVKFCRIISGIIFWPLKICKGAAVLERELYFNSLFLGDSIKRSPITARELETVKDLKIGIVGNLSGNTMTPVSFLDFFASSTHKLYVYDISGEDLLLKKSKFHHVFSHTPGKDKWKNLEQICENINKDDLDFVVIADTMVFSACIASRLAATAIYYYSFGSGVLPKIERLTNILCQPQIDFQVRQNCVYSFNLMRNLEASRTISIAGYYDRRGIAIEPVNEYSANLKIVFYHGSIYKILNFSFLKSVSHILLSQVDLKFMFVGQGTVIQLLRLKLTLFILGISKQCLYLPHIKYSQGEFGNLGEILSKSLVFLNPWPVGAGAARFEAYASGIPVAHLELFDSQKLKKTKSRTVVDVLGFETKINKNRSIDDYVGFVLKAVNDSTFREKILDEQLENVEYLSSSTRWWNQVIEDFRIQFKS